MFYDQDEIANVKKPQTVVVQVTEEPEDSEQETEQTEQAEQDDSELLALIDEVIALSDAEAQIEATVRDPFAELLSEIISALPANSEYAPAPTRAQVAELAEELAEETVAEAIQNVAEATETAEAANEVDEINDVMLGEDDEVFDASSDSETAAQSMQVGAHQHGMDANSKLALAKRALLQARDTLTSVIDLLSDEMMQNEDGGTNEILKRALHTVGARVVEGVFDGERMMSGDGRIFPVPPNYASKSKLVEGDILKLTVMPDGKMIYKQIGPTARDRVRGVLSCDERGGYCVLASGSRYKVIPASVSFFRGRPGDQVVALVPKGSPSKFAAVDFIVHQ